jgi:tRNA(fMet)-specific endonuclease VapC
VSKAIGNLGLDANAAAWIESAAGLFLPVTCLGELEYGAIHSDDPKKHRHKLRVFLQECRILEITRRTATTYAGIREALARKGKPIPEADMWIAATCLTIGLAKLLSADEHFDEVPSLRRVDWTHPMPRVIGRRTAGDK